MPFRIFRREAGELLKRTSVFTARKRRFHALNVAAGLQEQQTHQQREHEDIMEYREVVRNGDAVVHIGHCRGLRRIG
jgi:hypothetical protein